MSSWPYLPFELSQYPFQKIAPSKRRPNSSSGLARVVRAALHCQNMLLAAPACTLSILARFQKRTLPSTFTMSNNPDAQLSMVPEKLNGNQIGTEQMHWSCNSTAKS
jgi:hypothetical protein